MVPKTFLGGGCPHKGDNVFRTSGYGDLGSRAHDSSTASTPALRIVRKTIRILVVGGRLVIIIDSDVVHSYTQSTPIKAFRPRQNITTMSHRPTTRAPANPRAPDNPAAIPLPPPHSKPTPQKPRACKPSRSPHPAASAPTPIFALAIQSVHRDSISSNISNSRMSTPKKIPGRNHITPPLQKNPRDVFCKCTKNAGDAAVMLPPGVSGG